MKTNLTPHGIEMLSGWGDDVSEAEVRRREALAAARVNQPYRRPCELALRLVRPVNVPDELEAQRWREWDAGNTKSKEAA